MILPSALHFLQNVISDEEHDAKKRNEAMGNSGPLHHSPSGTYLAPLDAEKIHTGREAGRKGGPLFKFSPRSA